jgi:hypothetical protein
MFENNHSGQRNTPGRRGSENQNVSISSGALGGVALGSGVSCPDNKWNPYPSAAHPHKTQDSHNIYYYILLIGVIKSPSNTPAKFLMNSSWDW